MAQFDVFQNPNPASRGLVPFLVSLPADLHHDFDATVVAPLRFKSDDTVVPVLCLNPLIKIEGIEYILRPQELAAIATRNLKQPVANISSHRDEIRAALDFLFSGF